MSVVFISVMDFVIDFCCDASETSSARCVSSEKIDHCDASSDLQAVFSSFLVLPPCFCRGRCYFSAIYQTNIKLQRVIVPILYDNYDEETDSL